MKLSKVEYTEICSQTRYEVSRYEAPSTSVVSSKLPSSEREREDEPEARDWI